MTKSSAWYWLESGSGPADLNMAMDEALLEAAPRLGVPVLRFYGWAGPAASFGYFQKYAEVESATPLRPLVRRTTGGGVVPHDADWTYSLVFPAGHEWYELKAADSYRRLHEWLVQALATSGITAEVADAARHTGPGQCFVGHEKFDVLWHGRKIAGAAQRRTRTGLLIQGSVQPPPAAPPRRDWEQALRGTSDCAGWEKWTPDAALLARVAELSRLKYSQSTYNQRR